MERLQASLDRVAIGVSALCAFHCLVVPGAVVLLPTLGGVLASDEGFHRTLFLLVVPSSICALGFGCWRHRDRTVLMLGGAGVGTLLLTVLMGHVESWERVATLAGSSLVMLGHARNFALCRARDCSHGALDESPGG